MTTLCAVGFSFRPDLPMERWAANEGDRTGMGAPGERGFRLAADAAPHERCVIAWPALRRADDWRGHLGAARDAFAIIARTINEYEPVLMVADIGEGRAAEAWLGGEIEVIELPTGAGWIRDDGPVFLLDEHGRRTGASFAPRTHDPVEATLATKLCAQLGIECHEAPLDLHGGAFVTDGAGTLIATEQFLLAPGRRRGRDRGEIEHELARWFGCERVIWLTTGLAEDDITDGHVDNVVSVAEQGHVLLQSSQDPDAEDHLVAGEHRQRLEFHGCLVETIEALPHDLVFGEDHAIPFVNLYVANGAVFVPLSGSAADDAVIWQVQSTFVGREVIGVPGRVLAFGGGGVRRMTLPVPAEVPTEP